MWDDATADFYIYKLDLASQTWIKTPTRLDDRAGSRADALWDEQAQKLYVASHIFTESSGPDNTTSDAQRGKLWRFSYTPATDTYTLDAGFPVNINDANTETLVIDVEGTGNTRTLWATWVQQTTSTSGVYKVYVNRTLNNNDAAWGTPFELPVAGATVLTDDISAIVCFGGDKIGVMWSNQSTSAMYFAEHVPGTAATTWQARRTALQGPNNADDHINLKSLVSDGSGRVVAAVKTSHTTSSAPLVMLLVRNPATGEWHSYRYGRVTDHHTRPIVLLNQTNNVVHMFATADENGGSIYRKQAPISSFQLTANAVTPFAEGLGSPFIEEAATPGIGGDMNNATSTKQPVDCTTGIVVLATNDTTDRYWHNYEAIPGCGTPPPATATTTSQPTATRTPTAAATATSQPTVTATATSQPAATATATTVPAATSTTQPPTGSTFSFTPVADAYVNQGSPTTAYATNSELQAVGGSSTKQAFLRFTVSGLPAGARITSAKLQLVVAKDSTSGGIFSSMSKTDWAENITWNTKPAIDGPQLASLGGVGVGAKIEVDVAAVVTGNRSYSFAVTLPNTNTLGYASRQASTVANRPQLIIITQ